MGLIYSRVSTHFRELTLGAHFGLNPELTAGSNPSPGATWKREGGGGNPCHHQQVGTVSSQVTCPTVGPQEELEQ